MRMLSSLQHLLVLCLVGINVAASQSMVETLPGYDGPLPFKLETGYIWVGENKEMFYYFVESENDPTTDPLLVWLPGGCGCSALSSMVYENGPFAFDLANFDGSSLPNLILNPYSWTKGYVIGNPLAYGDENINARVVYAHRLGLISDQHFQLAQSSCNGDYNNPDPNNFQCVYALELIEECTDGINLRHILEPVCPSTSSKSSDSGLLSDQPVNLLTLSSAKKITCRDEIYITSEIWANDESVRESLHIRKGTKSDWVRCYKIPFEANLHNIVEYHQLLADRGIQGLIYSGDHDMLIPYIGTLKWINQLNLTLDESWRPWIVDGQVAGYTEKYKHTQAQGYFVFATVKGAGHTAPEYKPKECFAMIQRWFSLYPL